MTCSARFDRRTWGTFVRSARISPVTRRHDATRTRVTVTPNERLGFKTPEMCCLQNDRCGRSLPPLVTAAIARRRRRRTFVVGAGRPRNPTLVVGPPTDRVFGRRTAVRRRRPAVCGGPQLDVRLPSAAVPPAVRAGLRRRYRRVTRRVVGATFLRRDRWPVLARRGTVGRRFRSTHRLRSAGLVPGAVGSSRDVPLRPQPAAPATVAAHGRVLRVPHSVAPALAVGHRAAVGRSEKHVLNTNVFLEKLLIFRPRGTVILTGRFARTKTQRVRDRSGNLRGSQRCYYGYRR